MARDPQLLKGVLPMLVLRILARQESYGYELVTRLQAAGLQDIAAGTVYPILSRLEREGLITSRLVPSTSGPARKYYLLTAAGEDHLENAVAGWHTLSATVTQVLERPPTAARVTAAPPTDTTRDQP
ncbi:PadR family transcriptional regulator [Actinotalea sp. BY-33]|uniref:PadR family transcriptional regulator n=1 Tax=Actinotalea soli TaxID=2819234 RepID=A0A939LUC8_9CELL|nr:PadR family transcriptional regulator [Actinotalea soli]MBO1752299.1 PadR family transcriptional regulator [Actinotalea soli]